MTESRMIVQLPADLANRAQAAARVRRLTVNDLMVQALTREIERVRGDDDFVTRARELLDRDRELLEQLDRWPSV